MGGRKDANALESRYVAGAEFVRWRMELLLDIAEGSAYGLGISMKIQNPVRSPIAEKKYDSHRHWH